MDEVKGETTTVGAEEPPSRRRAHDSSKTRVAPVFDALQRQEAGWVGRLLDLAAGSSPGRATPWRTQTLHPVDGFWGDKERGLRPPVSLLSWLIRNAERPPRGSLGPGPAVVALRQQLIDGESSAIEAALASLRRPGAKKSGVVLEGRSYPDAYLVTPDALIVVEGKRTERGPTTSTTWMAGRHQILRQIDAAYEIAGRRSVYGLFVVEADIETDATAVPARWLDALRESTSSTAIEGSLPHRGPREREAIANALVGITTWQAIRDAFGLDVQLDPVVA